MVSNHIEYVMVQIKGISSHAWLITNVTKTATGWDLLTDDSNFLQYQGYHYQTGDNTIHTNGYGDIMIYIQNTSYFDDFKAAADQFCNE